MSKTNIICAGTFSLLHKGHIELFDEASKFGDVVVVLNTDEFVERYKGLKPIDSLYERATSIPLGYKSFTNIGCEDFKKTIEFIEEQGVKVDAIAHGTDWTGDSLLKQMGLTQEYLDEKHISMIYIPRTTGESSTRLRELMK